jgi:hypothetical protein
MELNDKVFCKDIQCYGKIIDINTYSIKIYLDKIIELEDTNCPLINGDLTNSLNLSKNKDNPHSKIVYLIEEDFTTTYPKYKTRVYNTNEDNLKFIK